MRLHAFLLTIGFVSIVLVAFGCTSSPKYRSSGSDGSSDSSDKSGKYRLEQEGKAPPLSKKEVKKEIDMEEVPVESEDVLYEEVDELVDSMFVVEEIAEEPEAVTDNGFRVQILAISSALTADEMKFAVEQVLSVPAYVVHENDLFKVRVGDCKTREEAEALLARCKASGYPDAWIVQSPVIIRKTSE